MFDIGEGSSFLDFSRGDLILLDEENTGETVLNSGWCAGTNERTEERGDFPAEAVYVLPCLNKPPDDILVRIIAYTLHYKKYINKIIPYQINQINQILCLYLLSIRRSSQWTRLSTGGV